MNSNPQQRTGMGIALRIALWSWLVALLTLLIFAIAIIPQQKRAFRENLESKAHGIAVSLRDVAAAAVVNEDFSTVVDHCKEMLNGDPALEYLVVTKNDGFSLISDRGSWRLEPQLGPEWRPAARVLNSGIDYVPLFHRRAFHYSQPFDYSGIQWGWIHVGVSLKGYDRSVTALYRRTGVLAVLCVLLSLAASAVHARRLVRPLRALQAVVHRFAGGDLSVRAVVERADELGSLGRSVNLMAETLVRRDRILQSVRFAAQQFLRASDWRSVIEPILAQIGLAAGVSRVRVFERRLDAEGSPWLDVRFEWTGAGLAPGDSAFRTSIRGKDFSQWAETIARGEPVSLRHSQLNEVQRQVMEPLGFKAILVVPILIEHSLWGLLTLAETSFEREWSEAERDSLRAAADMLGGAIARQRVQDALVEAKANLEQRVQERTKELQEQVRAKDRAHAQLAEAQHKLFEASRQAGMAEVATGVLHNVGNVLNSVNVSANVIHDRLNRSHSQNLARVGAMLEAHRGDLAAFLTADPKGQRIPEFLRRITSVLEEERHKLQNEVNDLLRNVEHIKQIVAMQQSYAKVAGVIEDLPAAELVEDAVRMNEGAFLRQGVAVKRDYAAAPPVRVDRHKVLQILVNLLRNANHAMKAANRAEKILTLRVGAYDPHRVRIVVSDNGVGIAPENLTRIFSHGFTTKKDGHGFGLHSGALAAKEMGGSLQAFSDGPDTGATFVLELPVPPASPRSPSLTPVKFHEPPT